MEVQEHLMVVTSVDDRTNPLIEAYLTREPNSLRQVWREVFEANPVKAINT